MIESPKQSEGSEGANEAVIKWNLDSLDREMKKHLGIQSVRGQESIYALSSAYVDKNSGKILMFGDLREAPQGEAVQKVSFRVASDPVNRKDFFNIVEVLNIENLEPEAQEAITEAVEMFNNKNK